MRDGITLSGAQICKLDRTLTAAPAESTCGIRVTQLMTNLEGSQFKLDASMADDDTCCAQIKNACSQVNICTEGFSLALLFLFPSSMVTLTVVLLTFTDTSAVLAFLPCTLVLCMLQCFGCTVFTKDKGCGDGWLRMCDRKRVDFEGSLPWLFCTTWISFVIFLITFPLALDGYIPHDTSGDWAIAFTPMWIWAFMVTVLFPCVVFIIFFRESRNPIMVVPAACCLVGITGTFFMLLVALCMKPSGDWDLMPYAAFSGTIAGLFVCAGATMCAVLGNIRLPSHVRWV